MPQHRQRPISPKATPETHPLLFAQSLRELKSPIVCPAGEEAEEIGSYPACLCRIERRLVSARSDPSSYIGFCTQAYVKCPTWTMAKVRDGVAV